MTNRQAVALLWFKHLATEAEWDRTLKGCGDNIKAMGALAEAVCDEMIEAGGWTELND